MECLLTIQECLATSSLLAGGAVATQSFTIAQSWWCSQSLPGLSGRQVSSVSVALLGGPWKSGSALCGRMTGCFRGPENRRGMLSHVCPLRSPGAHGVWTRGCTWPPWPKTWAVLLCALNIFGVSQALAICLGPSVLWQIGSEGWRACVLNSREKEPLLILGNIFLWVRWFCGVFFF